MSISVFFLYFYLYFVLLLRASRGVRVKVALSSSRHVLYIGTMVVRWYFSQRHQAWAYRRNRNQRPASRPSLSPLPTAVTWLFYQRSHPDIFYLRVWRMGRHCIVLRWRDEGSFYHCLKSGKLFVLISTARFAISSKVLRDWWVFHDIGRSHNTKYESLLILKV